MNALPNADFWLLSIGSLALQSAVVLLVAAAAQPLLRSPRWRRAAWLAALVGVAVVLGNALTGLEGEVAGWFAKEPSRAPQFVVRSNLPVGSELARSAIGDTEFRAAAGAVPTPVPGSTALHTSVWWPAWAWLVGTALAAARAALRRVWLGVLLRRDTVALAAGGRQPIEAIAVRLGLRRRVRVVVSRRLAGPIAFGVVRPSIGVPFDFWSANSRPEQDAMLAHELAHLAARDPLWLALADMLVALLWWHPLVWWARRQFRATSETAADEASLVVEDGPAVLASCLVALAARWQRRGALGLLGMAGFRSALGRRVERLLQLRAAEPPNRRGGWPHLWLAATSVAVLAAARAVPAWVMPAQAAPQTSLLAVVGEAWVQVSAPKAAAESAKPAAAPAATNSPSGGSTEARPQAQLIVQLPKVPGRDVESVRLVSMDALTRRLDALEHFGRVTCETLDDDRLAVALTLRAEATSGTNSPAEVLRTAKRVIEQPGQLEFRRVHPESDDLLARAECPDGFEVVSQSPTLGDANRRFVVAREAASGLGSSNLVESVIRRESGSGDLRVGVTFDAAGATNFAELTRGNVGRRIAVLLDGQVLMAPRVNEPILGGKCEISGNFTLDEARLLAASLAHPLPWKLKVIGEVILRPGGSASAEKGRPAADQPPAVSTIATTNVLSIQVLGGDRIALNQEEQTLGALRQELQRRAAAASPPVARISSSPEVPVVDVTRVVEACRDAGITAISVAVEPVTAAAPATREPLAALMADTQRLYEKGKLDEAKAKAEEALRLDSGYQAAQHYLNLVREASTRGGAAAAPPDQLFTRTFRVNPSLLAQNLARVGGPNTTNLPPQETLRRLLSAAGLDSTGPNAIQAFPSASNTNIVQNPSGKALFFNDQTGMLLVRTTRQDLDLIASLVEVLNAAPPQVVIEAKFVELTDNASGAPSLDWLLGSVPMATNQAEARPAQGTTNGSAPGIGVFPGSPPASSSAATGGVATLTGIMTDPQFREVIAALQRGGTNAVQELRGDQLQWPGRDATNAANIRVSSSSANGVLGSLSDEQYRTILRALDSHAGADILAAPRVTTLSGRQAQIQIVDIRTVVTGLNSADQNVSGARKETNAVPFTSAAIPVGPTLDVIPNVSADGTQIDLSVISTVTEFLGYDAPPKGARVSVQTAQGTEKVAMPLPRFRVRQMQTHALVADGQTLVLGGFPVEDTRHTQDKVPVLGDLPLAGRLFRSESTQTVRKTLLVFVTATVIDPAGNPVHGKGVSQWY